MHIATFVVAQNVQEEEIPEFMPMVDFAILTA